MNIGGFRLPGGLAQRVVVGLLLTYGAVTYARATFREEPKPALHGAGLAVALLNLCGFPLLVAGIFLLSRRDRIGDGWRTVGYALLAACLPIALALYGINDDSAGAILFAMVAMWVLINHLPTPWGVGVGLAVMLAYAIAGEMHGNAETGLLTGFLGVGLGAFANRARRAAQDQAVKADAANLLLSERAHLAREIHDILAHSLSAQLVHLEGARLLLSRDGDRVQVLDRVERAQGLARAGLEETRRALATLRGDSPPPDEALAGMAEEYHDLTGRPCEMEVAGTPRELPAAAGLAVIRTAQEALTNARKHAPGASVRMRLAYLEDRVELDVTDSGGTEPPLEGMGGGYGLVGMRERAELIGGTLETGPEGEGFRVSLRVPA